MVSDVQPQEAHSVKALFGDLIAAVERLPVAQRDRLLPEINRLMDRMALTGDQHIELLHHFLLETSSDAVVSCDAAMRIRSWNPSAERLYGWSTEEVIGRKAEEVLSPYGCGLGREEIERLQHGETISREAIHHRRDGATFWVEMTTRAIVEAGGIRGYLNIFQNINERKLAEITIAQGKMELIEETNRLIAVMEALPAGVCLLDKNGGIVLVNSGYEEVWGGTYDATGSVKDYDAYLAWDAITGEPLRSEEWASARAVLHGERVLGQFLQIQRFDGRRAYVLNSAAPIYDAEGRISGCAVVIIDISDRIQAETALLASLNRAEIQSRLLEQRERDRQEIARDIHDGPVQTLASTLFNLHIARAAAGDPALVEQIEAIGQNVKAAVDELRTMIYELRPPSVIRFGLARAIADHAEDFRSRHPHLRLDLDLPENERDLPKPVCVALYRIYKEALNNVVRHAEATEAQVHFSVSDERLVLEIRDNGRGFRVDRNLVGLTENGHFGLAGIHERADALDGEVQIYSTPGQGTMVRVTAPLMRK